MDNWNDHGFRYLGLGFAGYSLPWTAVSKSATDVGPGMISALPQPLSSFLQFLLVGSSGDSGVLLRFYDLHVVVLPAVLLILLAMKMYMLEALWYFGTGERIGKPSRK